MLEEVIKLTNDVKHKIIDEIEKKSDVFYRKSNEQYLVRCPICGDSQKNSKDAHCYIKCSNDPNEPLLYMCFKCNSAGMVSRSFLEKMGVRSNITAELDNQRYNKVPSIKKMDINIITGDPVMNSLQTQYIEKRLGSGFTSDDYDRFKIVWDMTLVYPYITDQRVKNSMPINSNSVSFLSDDKSLMLTRSFDDDGILWRKTNLFPSDNRAFYTIKSTIDLFTSDTIEVNIAEGVMDVLSIYRNFASPNNAVFIAAMGSDYVSSVDYAIAKGLIGNNIVVKIYVDDDINEKSLKYKLKKYKWIFKEIYIYKNIKAKDVGVTMDKIKLIESKI